MEGKILEEFVLNILIGNGVRFIQIDFCGSGDSGGIEEILLFDSKKNMVQHIESKMELPPDLRQKIEDLGYEYIEKSDDIDFNNDGCQGNFIIDLKKKTIKKENNVNVVDTQYSEEEWEL